MEEPTLGTVRIAPSVLATIVSLTARAVRGVADMSSVSRPPARMLHSPHTGSAPGVTLTVRNGNISADVYIVAVNGTNLRALGHEVQQRVIEALENMVAMPSDQVNVYIEDVSD
ncbi:MAG TPA: Asp23/Gls24 family envelope stress response protein [Chloroflexia bacterium]|nr:Asp23/Gls24 family envelope stress response protein [Chloroflexia bacterium]